MFGKKVTVTAMVRDKRQMGPGHVTVQCDAKLMNGYTANGEIQYRAGQAMGLPDSEHHNIEVYSYEIHK